MRQAEEEARSGEKAKEEAAWGEVLAADQAMTVALWRAAEKAKARADLKMHDEKGGAR